MSTGYKYLFWLWKKCPQGKIFFYGKAQGKESNQAQARGPNSDAPKKNHFYALRYRCDQVDPYDVVTGMFQVF